MDRPRFRRALGAAYIAVAAGGLALGPEWWQATIAGLMLYHGAVLMETRQLLDRAACAVGFHGDQGASGIPHANLSLIWCVRCGRTWQSSYDGIEHFWLRRRDLSWGVSKPPTSHVVLARGLGSEPRPVSGRPMEECPWPGTLAPEYVEGLRQQGHDVSEMEPWVQADDPERTERE